MLGMKVVIFFVYCIAHRKYKFFCIANAERLCNTNFEQSYTARTRQIHSAWNCCIVMAIEPNPIVDNFDFMTVGLPVR
jgi:hypothetical protein